MHDGVGKQDEFNVLVQRVEAFTKLFDLSLAHFHVSADVYNSDNPLPGAFTRLLSLRPQLNRVFERGLDVSEEGVASNFFAVLK